MYRSINTVGADVARREFGATGDQIVWAVLDSGIDGGHEHFRMHRNLDVGPLLQHQDFTANATAGSALVDEYGHGTHVAGIVAGERLAGDGTPVAAIRVAQEDGAIVYQRAVLPSISGMAPLCKIVSMKVLGETGTGPVSNVIGALRAIQEINVDGRALRIHGALIALGYDYDMDRFECGLSPLCVEVDRLVRSGVVVVCAAGNRGVGYQESVARGAARGGMEGSIDDPGNSHTAITVGSTHRELPRLYGVSYYSAKGPTLDGRTKPDLVAPGARIVSCAAGGALTRAGADVTNYTYIEESGTAMAAAHVAGIAAAFLSVRRDLIGKPDVVKDALLGTAVDLERDENYQGRGLVDLRAALTGQHAAPEATPVTQAPVATPRPLVADNQPHALRLACSYSHRDATLRKELDVYIAPLRRQGLITSWYDGEIQAGDDWRKEITKNFEEADIIVLLISAEFLASDFCYDVEMKRALERHDDGTARVIPVIVRDSDWSTAPFARLQALPKEGTAVTSWPNQDAAWTDVALGIRRAVERMRKPAT